LEDRRPGRLGVSTVSGLRRFVHQPSGETEAEREAEAEREPQLERCEMCGAALPEEHGHVVNIDARSLLCTCRPCYLLFTPDGAAGGRFRAVPDRYRYARDLGISSADWDLLQIPVGMAFFFDSTPAGRTVCLYPSPGGATESELALDAFDEIRRFLPFGDDIVADVEALILRRRSDGFECYLAPIDACYELVGRMRVGWRGFDGGQQVRDDIERFFADLRRRSGRG
jgi:hypothetical protein